MSSPTTSANTITREEFDFILSHTYPSTTTNKVASLTEYSLDTLKFDYQETTALEMMDLFRTKSLSKFIPCLHVPGIGTRYKEFYNFLLSINCDKLEEMSGREAFEVFGQHLGRIRTFRALALTPPEYEKIVNDDSIFPTGRLKTDKETVESMVEQHGIWKICHARLYIGQRMVKYDPSLSLHDHSETTTCIASHYTDYETNRKVHLMELSIPKIEVLGYFVRDVSYDRNSQWFYYGKIWFDSFEESTERYTLYEIPFLSQRMLSLRIFESTEEIKQYLQPFRESQNQKKIKSDEQSRCTNQQ